MTPAPSIALKAKLFLRHSKSTDVLTEQGRQVNNVHLRPSSAYRKDGTPRLGFSREPADFAFAAFVKIKSKGIHPTKGENILSALRNSQGPTQNKPPVANKAASSGNQADSSATRNISAAENNKGTSLRVSA